MTTLPALTRAHHILLAVLHSHIGAARGIDAAHLVVEVNAVAGERLITERQLRQLIVDLRLRGHHVCALPETGYFVAADEAELHTTLRFLYTRGMTTLQQVAAMRRVSLPDLAGQLKIRLEPTNE